MSALPLLPLKDSNLLENREVWAALTVAHRYLAELKGLCEALPNQRILLDTLGIQEAKDSSEIENIITTHDELYAGKSDAVASPAGASNVAPSADFSLKAPPELLSTTPVSTFCPPMKRAT